LSAGAGVVALHACGALHTALVRETRTTRVVLAPCCYDKALDASGQAELVSRAARAALPPLDVEALRLIHEAPSETGEGELGRVRQMQAWRLGLDRCHLIVSGSAPLTSHVMEFLRIVFACSVVEGYGQTECGGAATVSDPADQASLGHVGGPLAKQITVPAGSVPTNAGVGVANRPAASRSLWAATSSCHRGHFRCSAVAHSACATSSRLIMLVS
jgi:hypothetical protein